ncbi:MAG: hypothetical protein IJZ79_02720 [Bacilli bacterium]|nr:hypothetical protein [Bacilli bacterium]MBQ8218638.1 hypothetical protein [Bacilli bacterium]
MSRLKSIYNKLPIIVVSLFIVISTIASITIVHAAAGSFHAFDTNWDGYYNKISASEDDTYPYNSSTATITSMSMDVLYGTKRDFTFYRGEFPYDCIYDSDDEYEEGWEGMYAEDGTSATGTNPNYGASATVSAKDYWGLDNGDFSNQPTAEQINAGNMVSVRLWASSKTKNAWFANILYIIINGAAWLATLVIGLIVQAKNLDMDMIMNILRLDDLNDTLTKNFIYNGDTVSLSAFTGFCIIALIISLAAFTIRWVKGANKTQGIWEIIGTAGLGLLIIGMCLTGRISSLGSSVADMANAVMYTTAQSLSSSGQGDAFLIDVTDADNSTEITQMCEMALVNKAYIDLQLCAQFNVSTVDDLNFSKFGDTNGVKAKQYLSGVTNADMKKDFNNNLGYYYWFANSSAVEKTANNKTFPTTDTVSVTNKLSSMVTYLQVQYNNATSSSVKSLITKVTESLANPSGGPKYLALLVFAVALVLMAIVLLKYALNVIIGKLELFVALLGMIIAGPLILTANKKLVETGKIILGMLVVAFLEITVYSVIFDIIIYTVSAMFAPEIPNLLATIAMLLLLLKFNPIIAQKIKQLLEKTERKISPALSDGKRAIKNYARNKANEGMAAYDRKTKIVGYDENGKAIEQSRKGDALSKLMHQGANALLTEGHDHQSALKIGRELNKEHENAKATTAAKKRKAAQNKINAELAAVNEDANLTEREVQANMADTKNSAGEWDEHGHLVNINEEGLNEQELETKRTMEELNAELEDLQSMDKYKKLVAEQEHIIQRNAERAANGEEALEMDEKRKAELAAMKMKIAAKKKQVETEKQKIENSIKERAATNAFRKVGLEYKGADAGSIEDQLKAASRQKALRDHKDSLESTLKEGIATMTAEVNEGQTTVLQQAGRKIGDKMNLKSDSNLNREAATDQAAAMLQLSQLQNNMDVMDTASAQQEVKDIIDNVATKYDGTLHSKAGNDFVQAADSYKHNTQFGTKGHRQARKEFKETSANFSEQRSTIAQNSKDALKEAKQQQGVKSFNTLTASEFIQGQVSAKAANQAANNTSSAAKPNPYQQAPQVSQIINQRQESRQNAVDNITPPPVAPIPNQSRPNNTQQVNRQQQAPQPARQQAAPARPNPYQNQQTSTYESRAAEPTMAEARQQVVSPVEARQAQSRQAAPEPDMASIIKNREVQSQQQQQTPVQEQSPVHSRTDNRRSYEQDEARKMRRQADEDYWADKQVNRPGSRN